MYDHQWHTTILLLFLWWFSPSSCVVAIPVFAALIITTKKQLNIVPNQDQQRYYRTPKVLMWMILELRETEEMILR